MGLDNETSTSQFMQNIKYHFITSDEVSIDKVTM